MRFVLRSRAKRDPVPARQGIKMKSIIHYTSREKPRNDYPRRIISPIHTSACCTPDNRVRVGEVKDVEGLKFFYKMCRVCCHTVKFFFNPQYENAPGEITQYLRWRHTSGR